MPEIMSIGNNSNSHHLLSAAYKGIVPIKSYASAKQIASDDLYKQNLSQFAGIVLCIDKDMTNEEEILDSFHKIKLLIENNPSIAPNIPVLTIVESAKQADVLKTEGVAALTQNLNHQSVNIQLTNNEEPKFISRILFNELAKLNNPKDLADDFEFDGVKVRNIKVASYALLGLITGPIIGGVISGLVIGGFAAVSLSMVLGAVIGPIIGRALANSENDMAGQREEIRRKQELVEIEKYKKWMDVKSLLSLSILDEVEDLEADLDVQLEAENGWGRARGVRVAPGGASSFWQSSTEELASPTRVDLEIEDDQLEVSRTISNR